MVDPAILATDVVGTSVSLAIPAVLWLFLYLVAWEDPETGRRAGFERRTFWLLLPAGFIASLFGTLPFFSWRGDVLAVSIAGGLVPLVLSTLFLERIFGGNRRPLTVYLGALTLESAGLLLLVVKLPSTLTLTLSVIAVAVAAPLVLALVPPKWLAMDAPTVRATAWPFAMSSLLIAVTFLTTAAVPGVGIVSNFPFYLIAPVAAGVVAVPVASLGLRLDSALTLPLAYSTSTFGVLVGGDVLRQPPLYGTGPSGILSIGGAGLFDLLYLSGLLAAAVAYVVPRMLPRAKRLSGTPASASAIPSPRPSALLRQALDLGSAGRSAESVRASAGAARGAVGQARRLAGLPEDGSGGMWAGLEVPAWLEADQRNLDALAASTPLDTRDANRAWVTANSLVRSARAAGQRRFASPGRRSAAFGIDLAVTLAPAVAVWATITTTTPGGILGVLTSIPLNAAALGYAAWAYLYLVVGEATFGTTVGKRLVRVGVTDRSLRRPGILAVLLRNAPKLIPLSIVGLLGAILTVYALSGDYFRVSAGSAIGGAFVQALSLLLLAVLIGLGLLASAFVGWVGILLSGERQRLGDVVAGTWVILDVPPKPPGVPAVLGPPTYSG